MKLLVTGGAGFIGSNFVHHVLTTDPDAKVVTTPKCKQMLIDMLHIEQDKFITVEDRETLSLGNKTLELIYLPWVHWPETFGTYLKEDKIYNY